MKTFYWYDYETFGISPKTGRIAQFGGIRTDENFKILDEKILYCRTTDDSLPDPESCKITGITPQLCEQKGLGEHAFITKIHHEFSKPETCIVGYNNIRFDDEFTRHTLYRNFLDPYTWHWKNGNSRWDIIDMVRAAYAFKKTQSLSWAIADGVPSFALERLTEANNIPHEAHDALSDVRATIAVAKIIHKTQSRLFDFSFSQRNKKTIAAKIHLFQPLLHTSGMYPPADGCTKLVVPLAYHPHYSDRAVVFNLAQNPEILWELGVEELQKLLFTKQSELPENVERLQLKEIRFNRSPIFFAIKPGAEILKNLGIDVDLCFRHLDAINKNRNIVHKKILAIYADEQKIKTNDPDQKLYDGFLSPEDRKIATKIQTMNGKNLAGFHGNFSDKNEQKLERLLLHFKARNHPESLAEDEKEIWFETVQSRVQEGADGYLSLPDFDEKIAALKKDEPKKKALWQNLSEYADLFR